MFKVTAKVLDAQSGKFQNEEGEQIVFSNAVIQTDEGVHSVTAAPDLDLKPHIGDKEVVLIAKLAGSIKKPAKVMITGVSASK